MFRLPDGWGTPELFEDVVVAGGVRLRRSGVAAIAPSGEEVVGSAAARREPTKRRAWFELAERVAIVSALAETTRSLPLFDDGGRRRGTIPRGDVFPTSNLPTLWVPARSSGVALHCDWASACARAYAELAERDRILRGWLGEVVPEEVPLHDETLTHSRRYEWRAYSFEAMPNGFASDISVVAVAGFPRRETDPLTLGFGARTAANEALRAATGEALQQLAFLWGEELPDRVAKGPPSPMTHLDTYQVPANRPRIRRWLEGGHRRYAVRRRTIKRDRDARVRFVELGAPWLGGRFRVAKAISEAALPLGFGELPILRSLPKRLRIHPIP